MDVNGYLKDASGSAIGNATAAPLYVSIVGGGALPAGAQGDIIWHDGTNWATLAPPTVNSRFLTYSTSSATMQWGAGGGGVTDHNDLSGIQGGSSGKYYHMTDTEYASVQTWNVATLGHNHDLTYLGLHAKADDADKLDNHDSTYFATTGDLSGYSTTGHNHNIWALTGYSTLDAYTLQGNAPAAFATALHNHDATYLGLHAKADDADKLDNHDSTYFATTGDLTAYSTTGHNHAHNNLTGLQGGQSNEYYHLTNAQNASVAAWNVATTAHNHNIWQLTGYSTLNADTLDGYHASDIIALTTGYSTWTGVPTFTRVNDWSFTVGGDSTANAAMFASGRPLRYATTSSPATWYYGVATLYSGGTVSLGGASLLATYGTMQWADFNRLVQIPLLIPGYYEDASDTTLLANDLGHTIPWGQGTAYLVKIAAKSRVADGSSDGKVNVRINGSDVCTSNTNAGLLINSTNWITTTDDISTSYYDINWLEEIEVTATKGTGGDAQDLSLILVFVVG